MIPSAISKAPLHSLHQDNQNEEQHAFFGHVTQLVLASHNVMLLVLVLHDVIDISVT